uniref:Biotin/lipoyl attachment domain-containing protein n=1 Tax=Solibacter usitatus (strain Ellin6076) TaxID=234267 RepID=Q01VB4_SOLUE
MAQEPSRRPGRRAYFLIGLFALALVLFPFLFWYGTWFGRALTDAEMDQYIIDTAKPRHIQHALVQLGERLSRGQDGKRWYANVVKQAGNPSLEIRQTAAWIMGQDRNSQAFHDALLKMLADPQPMVRRNAALSLAGFGDPAARGELAAMLRPYTVKAPQGGPVHYRLKAGDYVNPGTLLAHIGATEVRSPVPGEVRAVDVAEGATVKAGDAIAELAADQNHVWEALRALYLVGGPGDLEDVERFTRPMPGMSEKVVQQARLTMQGIQSHAAH